MNEFEITLTREEFLGSFGLTEEKLKNLEPLENIKKKDKLREELYQMLNDSENLKIYYDKNQEELTELLNTVKKISSDIESNYPEIEDTQIDKFIEITNFSWVSSIKLFLHFIPNDCFSRKFSGKININEISFKEDNKIDQATIDLYFPDKEEDFCIQGEPIIKHSLLYLFQFNIKKIYPKYLDFRIRSIKLKVLKNVEQKEILRSLLKDRTIIQKKYDNGIIEFKADYFYNVKNKSIHKKYNDLYNNMIETAISNLILSLPEYF